MSEIIVKEPLSVEIKELPHHPNIRMRVILYFPVMVDNMKSIKNLRLLSGDGKTAKIIEADIKIKLDETAYNIPDGWSYSFEDSDGDVCSDCNVELIHIVQSVIGGNEYKVICPFCGKEYRDYSEA